jgi:glyoxylase-like metal-dependent hydrolase (beta-lactamase superfamily II)
MDPIVTAAAESVFHVEGAGTNWQIVLEGSHVTLIDAAWPKDFDLVARSLALVGRTPADVEVILLTHAHRGLKHDRSRCTSGELWQVDQSNR